MDPLADALRDLQTAMAGSEIELASRMRINTRDLTALTLVAFEPGPVGPTAISKRVGITQASATELLQRLERAGHLVRTTDESDRRRTKLALTAESTADVVRHLASLFADLETLAARFTPEQRDVIGTFIEGATEAYVRYSEE